MTTLATSHFTLAMALKSSSYKARRFTTCRAGKDNLWSVEPVLKKLRKKRLEESTVERVYEADIYPAVLDFQGWRNHRSRDRYNEHMITLFRSYLLKDLSGPLLNATAVAFSVAIYNTSWEAGLLDHALWPRISSSLAEPLVSLMSFALSLMLVFRTNSSYARWVEARALWGVILNSGRSLVRMGLTSFPESSQDLKLALGRWTVGFARVCKLHLREEGELTDELRAVLQPREIALLQGTTHRPECALQVMSEIVAKADGLDSVTRARMEGHISALQDALGSCEKILRNPIPLSYTRHTARFLVLWLSFLPFSLWDRLSWGVVPATAIIAYLLLGIDEIAIQLEEPFGILPLENLCDTIQRNVKEMIDDEPRIKGLVDTYEDTWGGAKAPRGWYVPLPTSSASQSSSSSGEEEDEGVAAARRRAQQAATSDSAQQAAVTFISHPAAAGGTATASAPATGPGVVTGPRPVPGAAAAAAVVVAAAEGASPAPPSASG